VLGGMAQVIENYIVNMKVTSNSSVAKKFTILLPLDIHNPLIDLYELRI
jgi:hypothetical protein